MISSTEHSLSLLVIEASKKLFEADMQASQIQFQQTKKEFEGDITLVVFPLTKISKRSPEETGRLIGEYLQANSAIVQAFNCVKGFLNLVIVDAQWLQQFSVVTKNPLYGFTAADKNEQPVMVEYCSPNTNKPIHLGHMRNILLGWSVSEILKATGNNIVKTNIVNDRGIHICKSMLAWKKWGNGETPQSSGVKGDHLVGKYYVEFDKQLKKEKESNPGVEDKDLPLMFEAKEMLRKWEQGDKEVVDLWRMMNGWVYEGFDATYKELNVDFDKIYYESDTYLLGKKIVEEGLQKKVFVQDADTSVWIDLVAEGLDRKIMQRSDGTSVYITQDLGTATMRHDEYNFKSMIYVVGNEQDYHFKVLFKSLKKLGYEWADKCYHLSYAMVDLPSGKMKSREGTVVDADELIKEVIDAAKAETQKLGKVDEFSADELKQLYKTLGMGALKYFILKVDPEKRMLFNPEESVEIHGNTGPYIQYVHARICSMLRSASKIDELKNYSDFDVTKYTSFNEKEKELVKTILSFSEVLQSAAQKLSPALLANYVYELSRVYNQFYHENTVIDQDHKQTSLFRLQLSAATAATIKKTLALMGIDSPERM